ncbi:hypothetical protein CYLTODRAFT_419531 [Cylindrobasidium torrendii FP15055 ss-10]|uniref:F-box domain-containing protein n=1 Tax=Cylindrobasidium torrendii FP15055 ss-10 TaxID=1314674 RepID=A0A0D7BJK9_9AGAR|nr:hypothetical protein CYLTODRAFT_419531 [Cylindrobasidium torrendii FP15055 ss-10]
MDSSVFDKLPFELVECILRLQEPERIAISREVCKLWKTVVDNSHAMLYAMTLAKYGLKENPVALPASVAERLVLLNAQVNSSWADMQPGLDAGELTIPSYLMWEFFGNVFALATDEKLVFHQFTSPRSDKPRLTWEVPLKGEGSLDDFAMDPSQDLLILARSGTSPPMLVTLLFHTMSTGHWHPLAKGAELTFPIPSFDVSSYYILVCGAYIGVHFNDGNDSGFRLLIINWTSGELCMELQSGSDHELASFAFISESHIAVCAVLNQEKDDPEQGIRIFNFLSAQKVVLVNDRDSVDLLLKFPEYLQGIHGCKIRCDPTPSWPGQGDTLTQFYDDPDELIYTISIRYLDGTITLVVRRASLLEHLGGEVWDVDWSDWGEQGASCVEINDSDSCWECRTFGSLMVTANEKGSLTVYDFNQKRARLLPEFLVDPFDNSGEEEGPTDLVPVWPNKSEDSEDELEDRDAIEDESDWETESETSSDADSYDCIAGLPFRKRVFPNVLPTGIQDAMMGLDCILLVDVVDREGEFRVLPL